MTMTITPGQTICLGFQTENEVETVCFDKSAWVAQYGPGTFELVHRRRKDTEGLPIAVDVDGGIVIWTITAADVAYRGRGEAQLRYYNAHGQIKASEIYETQVARSLTSDDDVPEPYEGWVEQVLQAGADAQLAQTGAEAAQTAAELAQGKAEDAQEAAETAQTAAETAQGLAEAAQTAAEGAQTAAETAQGKAEDAQEAAEAAQTAAETAQGKAEDAQEAAEAAQTAAETAQGKAEDAQEAAEASAAAAAESARTLTIDPTLSHQGQAADAFAAGMVKDAIAFDVTSAISWGWTLNQDITPDTGANHTGSSVKGIRTNYLSFSQPLILKMTDDAYIIVAWTYSAANTQYAIKTPNPAYSALAVTVKPSENEKYFRIGIRRADGVKIDTTGDPEDPTSELYKIYNAIKAYSYVDPSLMKKGMAAEALAVHDALAAKADAAATTSALAGKVDKVEGKVLSDNNFSDADKAALDNIAITDTTLSQSGKAADAKAVGDAVSTLDAALNDKVDKVEGKGLSDNNFSSADKAALDNIKTTDTTLAVKNKAADAFAAGMVKEAIAFDVTSSITWAWTLNQDVVPETGANKTGSSVKGIRTNFLALTKPLMIRITDSAYVFVVWTYSSTSASYAVQTPNAEYSALAVTVKPSSSERYFRVGIRRADGVKIDTTGDPEDPTSELYKIYNEIKAYSYVDPTLTQKGMAAEATETKSGIDKDERRYEFYIGNKGNIAYTPCGESAYCQLDVGSNNMALVYDGTSHTITPQSIKDAVSALGEVSYVSLQEDGVIIGTNYCIYCDLTDGSVKVIPASAQYMSATEGNIILFYSYYDSARAGAIVDYMTMKNADAALDAVPLYYNEGGYLDGKIADVIENMGEVGRNGETFIFITDIHWENNAQKSPLLIRQILDNTNVNNLLCGGDLINQGETKADAVSYMQDCIDAYKYKNLYMPCAFGNHDSNENFSPPQPEKALSAGEQYALMQKQAEEITRYWSETGWNFYVDKTATKTRFVFLDTGKNGVFGQYDDLADVLLATPEGYHIVILGHWLGIAGSLTDSCQNIMDIADAYNAGSSVTITVSGTSYTYDFSANTDREILLILGGHAHVDSSWTTTDGIPCVVTDCDNYVRTNSEYPHAARTIDEQCFDVFTIDYATKAVKACRFGRGADRTWTRS